MTEFLEAIGIMVVISGTVMTVMAAFTGSSQAFKNEKEINLHAARLRALEHSKEMKCK